MGGGISVIQVIMDRPDRSRGANVASHELSLKRTRHMFDKHNEMQNICSSRSDRRQQAVTRCERNQRPRLKNAPGKNTPQNIVHIMSDIVCTSRAILCSFMSKIIVHTVSNDVAGTLRAILFGTF